MGPSQAPPAAAEEVEVVLVAVVVLVVVVAVVLVALVAPPAPPAPPEPVLVVALVVAPVVGPPPHSASPLQSLQEQPSSQGTHSPLSTQCSLQKAVFVQSGQVQLSAKPHTPSGIGPQSPPPGAHAATFMKQSWQLQSSAPMASHAPSSLQAPVQRARLAQSGQVHASAAGPKATQ
jgi:hypothetical protein